MLFDQQPFQLTPVPPKKDKEEERLEGFFDPEGTGYDYVTAEKYGMKADDKGKWESRVEETGLILKGRGHPTWEETVRAEEAAGYEIYKGADGRYYSRPRAAGAYKFTPVPKKGEPKPEKESIWAKISPVLSQIKEVAPKLAPYIPGIGEVLQRGRAARIEAEKPEIEEPGFYAPTGKERRVGIELPVPRVEHLKAEDLEYGNLEKGLDFITQAMFGYINGRTWGLPQLLGLQETQPLSTAAELTRGLSHLLGMIGVGGGAMKGTAPFAVSGKMMRSILGKPAKTTFGKFLQNITLHAGTVGAASAAERWEGEDLKEILMNKGKALIEGAAVGGFFGTMQFVNFAKEYPTLSFIYRYGIGQGLLDVAEGKRPWDERTWEEKAYEYGLGAWFLSKGVRPSDYQMASKTLLDEIRRAKRDAAADKIISGLPESMEKIGQIAADPTKWVRPEVLQLYDPEALKTFERELTPSREPTFYATEKTVMPAGVPERERVRLEYEERAGRPREETVINIRQKPDKSWDITLPTAPVEPEVESPKELAMGSFFAHREKHPRILYESIAKSRAVQEGIVTPRELVDYIEARGKEVIEKPDIIPGPEAKEVKARAPQAAFKDPLLNAIAEEVGKIRPNPDYSRESLLKAGLPFRLIAARDATEYPTMDLAAQVLRHRLPQIEGDVDLYDMIKARKLGAMGVEYKTEKQRAEELEAYFEEKAEEFAEREETPFEVEEKPAAKFEPEKGELYRIPPELRAIEKALKERKELTEEQKEFLRERGAYEEKELPEVKPLPEVEEIERMEGPKEEFIRVKVTTPTGTVEDLGELPVSKIGDIKEYAKQLGIEGKVEYSQPRKGLWRDYLPPSEVEKYMKEVIRDVKKKPKEEWEKWEKDVDDEYNNFYSGLPPPEFVRSVGLKILSKLQTDKYFEKLGFPDLGFNLKAYHPARNAETERGEEAVKNLMKIGKKFGLKDEDYLKLTFLTSLPGYFKPMTPEQRAKFSRRGDQNTPYRIVRRFFDYYIPKLQELGIIEEAWPKSQLRRLREENIHLKALLDKPLKGITEGRKKKIRARIKDINETIEIIQKRHPQYVGIPRMWFELIWDRNPRTAPRIITELFKQRETVEIDKLADYLINTKFKDIIPKNEHDLYKAKDLNRPLLKKEDMDIRRMMFAYAHKVGHKLALAKIFRAAEKEGALKDADVAPRDWVQLPSWKYPTLKGKRAHPAFADFFEKNFVKKGFMPPKLGGILGTVKLFQFYNPAFLPMYDMVQAWWSGSIRSLKTPVNIARAAKSMGISPEEMKKAYKGSREEGQGVVKSFWDALQSLGKKDQHYWNMQELAGFSTPYTPSFDQYMKRAARLLKKDNLFKFIAKGKFLNPYELYKLSWHTAWTGDHFIRMITYHHYLSQGKTPREAAVYTAKMHADYASIPPATRKWMNKLFFTPSFKIAMMSAQADMVKGAANVLIKGRKAGEYEKTMAKALVGLASGIAIRESIMHALGFETDQFGLRYFKKIEDEEGEEKEIAVIAASPDNVVLRFWHRFKVLLPFIGKEENKLESLTNRAKWELHPMWQLGMELLSNKSVSLEPIWDPFDKKSNRERVMWDMLKYSTQRILRVTEVIPGTESLKRHEAYNALVKDLGKFGVILSGFVLPYTRTTREKALVYEINRLKSQFKYMNSVKPAKTDAEADRRLKNFEEMVEDIVRRLDELEKKK